MKRIEFPVMPKHLPSPPRHMRSVLTYMSWDPTTRARCVNFDKRECNGPCPRHRPDAYPPNATHRKEM